MMSIRGRLLVSVAAVVGLSLLTGCGTKGADVDDALTWQEAKADAQKMESTIAALVPADVVVSTSQLEEGTLLSCDAERHSWSGMTTIVLMPDVDTEALVRSIAAHYSAGEEFEVEEFRTLDESLMVHLVATDGEESYIAGPGPTEGEFEIDSGSKCFTLPEGTYPGGKF